MPPRDQDDASHKQDAGQSQDQSWRGRRRLSTVVQGKEQHTGTLE